MVEKLESQHESQVISQTELRRCVCPVCESRDVWKWGKPTLADRVMLRMFDKTTLKCRRCGHKFHRKVVFGQSS
jgi:hypothetical protein